MSGIQEGVLPTPRHARRLRRLRVSPPPPLCRARLRLRAPWEGRPMLLRVHTLVGRAIVTTLATGCLSAEPVASSPPPPPSNVDSCPPTLAPPAPLAQEYGASEGRVKAQISFVNAMGNWFRFQHIGAVFDEFVPYIQDDSAVLAGCKEIPIFSGAIRPGAHTLQVKLLFRGEGEGAFSYMRAIKFIMPGDYSFTAPSGLTVEIRVIAYEKGGQTPFEKRPAIRFEKKLRVGHRPEGPVVLPSTGRASYTISASTEAVDGT